MEKIYLQQGDLELVEVTEIPQTAKRIIITGNSFVLLKGEGTNTHELQSETLSNDIDVYEDNGVLYLQTKKSVSLIHSEHGTDIIEPNKIIKRRIEREWDYEKREAQNTRD